MSICYFTLPKCFNEIINILSLQLFSFISIQTARLKNKTLRRPLKKCKKSVIK